MFDHRNKPRNGYRNTFSPTHKTWRAVEKRVKNGVVVEVNELPLPIPKYSFVVSSAKTDDGGQIININRHIPLHMMDEAIDLLHEMQEKYAALRAAKQEEYDARRTHMRSDDEEEEEEPGLYTQRRNR